MAFLVTKDPVSGELRLAFVGQASSRGERHRLARQLRAQGKTWTEIAEILRGRLSVSARAAMRLAHGWTQQQAAEEWGLLWPDRPKDKKWFSYQERWPNGGRPPSLGDLDKLAQLYRCAVADLLTDLSYSDLDPAPSSGLDVRSTPEASLPDAAGAPTGLGVELWELHEGLRSGRVSAEVLDLAARASSHLDARFAELPPAVLSSELDRQFEHVVGWLHDPQPEAEEHDLASWLLGGQSLIPIDREDYRAAHALIAEAQPDRAGASFRAALAGLPLSRVKARAMLLLSLAMAAAQSQELDEAASSTREALTIASDQPIGRVWQRATEVRGALGPAEGSDKVRALDEHMAEFRAVLERATPELAP